MKKKLPNYYFPTHGRWYKTLLIMKISCLLTVFCVLQVSATGYSQSTLLNLNLQNKTVREVLKAIESESEFRFFYNDDFTSLNKKIDLNIHQKGMDEILHQIFTDANVTYKVMADNVVVIFPISELQQKVTGTITDVSTGESLPGVTILIDGTSIGVTSDTAGKYSIDVPNQNAVLVFSYLGYLSEKITFSGQSTIDVKLLPDIKTLNEVVVVGYGTQKKITLTGAVSAISSDEIVSTKNENVVNMMTGKIAGVRVLQRSGEPGNFDNLYDIRGLGTPLIVIDGVPRDGADLSRMNADEIESISVLKDASAAVYGVRSANGVILVTTKKGTKNGKVEVSYAYNYGIQQYPSLPSSVNAVDYMTLKNEMQKRDFGQNFFSQQAPAFSDADIELYKNGTLQSSDWVGATMRKSAPMRQHNLNLNGGTEKINYFFSLGYLDQESLFKSGDMNYNRWNYRGNVNINISDRLRANVLTSAYSDEKDQPNWDVWTMFKYTWSMLPTDQIYANNNPLYPHVEPDNANPVVITNSDYVGKASYINRKLQGQLKLEYDIPGVKGLTAAGMYDYSFKQSDNTREKKAYNLYTYDPQNQTYIPTTANSPSQISRAYYNTKYTTFQLSLNYVNSFNKVHNVNAVLLYEESHAKADNFNAQRDLALGIPYLFAGNTSNQVGSMDGNGLWENVNKGLIGKLNYDFKGKYIAEFGFRYDGSCKFKAGPSQWGFFPEASVGYRISEENFLKDLISPNILSNLKFRASYGELGDDGATGFQYISGYNYPATGYIFGGNYVNGLSSRGVVNPDLTWYTSKTLNLGLDVELWKGLLGASVDYFTRNRDGLLATRTTTLPGTVGTGLPQENLNSDRTRGIEITLTHRNKIGEVAYNISANISSTRTMLRHVEQTRAGNSYENWKNAQSDRNTNIWWGTTYEGQFTSYDQIYNYGVNTGGGNQSTVPGDYYYQDWNGDGVVDSKDEQPIAVRDLPLLNFGMTLGANWKGFDFSMLLQGATKYYVQYAEQLAEPLMYGRTSLDFFLDRWRTTDPTADVFNPNTTWIPGNYPAMGSPIAQGTKAVQDASYLRIKTIELGYTIPKKLLGKLKIKSLRVYVNSYNLATLTGLKNSDPEHPGVVATGEDWNDSQGGYKYPQDRIFNIGAKITF